MDRRSFLGHAAAITAAPMLVTSRSAVAQDAQIPYVDGLSFLPSNPSQITESGLTAFISDVSSGELIEHDDGTTSFYRSFAASARSLTAVRRALRDDIDQAFLATKGSDGSWSKETAEITNMSGNTPYILAFAQDAAGDVYALTSITTGPVGSLDTIYKIVPGM